jgi:hypothetical protein
MNIERFTEKAREAISDADKIARQYKTISNGSPFRHDLAACRFR